MWLPTILVGHPCFDSAQTRQYGRYVRRVWTGKFSQKHLYLPVTSAARALSMSSQPAEHHHVIIADWTRLQSTLH
jgi:hypothetical protein